MTKHHSLIDKVYAPANLAAAFHRGARRQGAAGPDGISWFEYRENLPTRLAGLAVRLRAEGYRFRQPRTKRIRTYAGGSLAIYIWNIEDRIVQNAVARVLWRALGPSFPPIAFGFIKSKGLKQAHAALLQRYTLFEAPHFFSLDIEHCFPSMTVTGALQSLCRCVSDGRVLLLVEDAVSSAATGTLPPGSPLSGLLANLFLGPLDVSLDGKRMLRYCDNILGFAPSHASAQADVERIVATLGILGLKPNVNRTKIVRAINPSLISFDNGVPVLS